MWFAWEALLVCESSLREMSGALVDGASHLMFASIVAMLAGAVTLEAASAKAQASDARRGLTYLAGIAVVVSCFATLGGSGGASNWIAASGVIGLAVLSYMVLGASTTIVGFAILMIGYAGHLSVFGDQAESLSGMVRALWSVESVFGDALRVSASFLLAFVAISIVLRRADAFTGFRRLVRPLLRTYASAYSGPPVSALLLTGAFSASTSAAIAIHDDDEDDSALRDGARVPPDVLGLVASSTALGQFMPPVMGISGLLISSALGLPFSDVLVAALVPAVILAVVMVYNFRVALHGPAELSSSFGARYLASAGLIALGISVGAAVLVSLAFTFDEWRSAGLEIVALIAAVVFIGQSVRSVCLARHLKESARFVDFSVRSGTFLVTPLIFVAAVFQIGADPALAALIAVAYGALSNALNRLLFNTDGEQGQQSASVRRVFDELVQTIEEVCRTSSLIALSLGLVGIVVAPVFSLGLGPSLTDIFQSATLGQPVVALVLVALIVGVLGLALSTTASYFIVASVMVPAVASIAFDSGIFPALISLHLFIFVFACAADLSPPDDFAVEGVARRYGMAKKTVSRAAIAAALPLCLLPFSFVGQNVLLLQGQFALADLLISVITVTFGLIVALHAFRGRFLGSFSLAERALLAVVAFVLILPPGVLLGTTQRTVSLSAFEAIETVGTVEQENSVTLRFADPFTRTDALSVVSIVREQGMTLIATLASQGVSLIETPSGDIIVERIDPLGFGETNNLQVGMKLIRADVKQPLFDYRICYIIALLVLLFVVGRRFLSSDRKVNRDA